MSATQSRATMKYAKIAARDGRQSDHLPYLRHLHDRVIKTKQGFYMGVIRLNGLCFQTLDQSEINLRFIGRNQTITGLGSSRYALYGHVIRREVDPRVDGTFDNPFVQELDARYMAAMQTRKMFQNEIYVTVLRRPMQGKVGMLDKMVQQFRMVGSDGEGEADILRELSDTLDAIARDMGAYGARVLSVVERKDGFFTEPGEFLAKLVNGGQEVPVALVRTGLDHYLPSRRLFFSGNAVELRGGADSKFGAMMSVKEYPPFCGPGMLDRLLQLPHEFIITQSFSLAERSAALDRMNKIGRQVSGSDHAGTAIEEGVAFARDRLATGQAVFGEHHMTVMPLVSSVAHLPRVVSEIGAELSAMNMAWVREDLGCEPAFWAQMPGNFSYIARRAMISSSNFAGFFSAHNFPTGERAGMKWGRPIALLETTSQTAYWMNFHAPSGLGHFSVIGPSGSGKTVALSFLLAQAMRVKPRPRCVFFDKDRGGEIFIRALAACRTEFNKMDMPCGYSRLGAGQAAGGFLEALCTLRLAHAAPVLS